MVMVTKAYLYLVLGMCRTLGRHTTFETSANYERLSECVRLCVHLSVCAVTNHLLSI